MPKAGRARTPRLPPGLTVERLEIEGEEMVVIGWEVAPSARLPALSNAETDVLTRVIAGQSNKQIARARKTSERTVANQVASLLRKTGAASRYELITRYGGRGG